MRGLPNKTMLNPEHGPSGGIGVSDVDELEPSPASRAARLVGLHGAGTLERERAARLLLDGYGGKIQNCLKRKFGCSGERAEDLLQDLMIKFFKEPPTPDGADGWLFKVVQSIAMDGFRRDRASKRNPGRPLEPLEWLKENDAGFGFEPGNTDSEPTQVLQALQHDECIKKGWFRMSLEAPTYTRLLDMVRAGSSNQQIAEQLNISYSAVTSRLSVAVKKARLIFMDCKE